MKSISFVLAFIGTVFFTPPFVQSVLAGQTGLQVTPGTYEGSLSLERAPSDTLLVAASTVSLNFRIVDLCLGMVRVIDRVNGTSVSGRRIRKNQIRSNRTVSLEVRGQLCTVEQTLLLSALDRRSAKVSFQNSYQCEDGSTFDATYTGLARRLK